MKDSSLSLTSAMMANLEGCKVGDEKTLSVPVRVTAYGDKGAEFAVTGAPTITGHESESEEEEGEYEGESEMPMAMAKMMAKRRAMA